MKRTMISWAVLVIGALGLGAGCDSTGSGSTGGPGTGNGGDGGNGGNAGVGGAGSGGSNGISLESLAAEMGKWRCGIYFSCCDTTELMTWQAFWTTQAQCEQSEADLFAMRLANFLQPGLDAGTVVYDGVAAMNCFAKFANDCTSFHEDRFITDPVCQSVFVGKLADGVDCNDNEECLGEKSRCATADGSALWGKCLPPPKEGESCLDLQCETGLYCAWNAGTPICKALVPNGGACADHTECTSQYCPIDTKVCTAQVAVGEACTSWAQCTSSNCDSTTNVCGQPDPVVWQCDGM